VPRHTCSKRGVFSRWANKRVAALLFVQERPPSLPQHRSLSLSLSLSHTHTRTDARTMKKPARKLLPLCSSMLNKLLKQAARQPKQLLLRPARRFSSLGFNCGASLHTHSFRAPVPLSSCSAHQKRAAAQPLTHDEEEEYHASYLNPTTVKKQINAPYVKNPSTSTRHPNDPTPSSFAPNPLPGNKPLTSQRSTGTPPPPFHKFLSSEAIPKYSHNPCFDFASSIVDMIMAHNLDDASDLEDLYHCYLELNAPKHHSTITTAFLTSMITLNLVVE
ncbi:hypothetical protein GOP47_0001231, partial [Adiantum capillus-veneris]